MKKNITIAVCALLATVIVAAAVVGGIFLYVTSTPEYALLKIGLEVKEGGFDAVLPNLTDNAYSKIEPILKLLNNEFVQSLLSLVSSDEGYALTLIEKVKEIDWTVGEMMKSSEKASVTISFDYRSQIAGSVDIELNKVDGEWKINDMYNLNVEKFALG